MPKLTKTTIDALGPRDVEYEIPDSAVPGFRVRVQPSGRKSFTLVYREGRGRAAKQRRYTIGRTNQLSIDQARTQASTMLALVRLGKSPFVGASARTASCTMNDLFDKFLAEYVLPKLKRRTAIEYGRMIDRHLRPAIGSVPVEALNSAHARDLHHKHRATPRLANHLLAVLSKCITEAEAWSLRPSLPNPCRGIRRYAERKRSRLLSPDELGRIAAGLDMCHPTVAVAIRVMILTGCRVSEVCSLTWNDVDFDRRELRLPDTKNGPLTKPMTGSLVAILKQWKEGWTGDWVFRPLRGGEGHLHRRVLSAHWTKLLISAGVSHAGCHAARHCFASAIYSDPNISFATGMKIVGHRSYQTALGYAHMSAANLLEATDNAVAVLSDAFTLTKDQ